ncbi:MAG: hypothetical protein KTR15_10920 [Phycisphaeraceae bacterium]|nr:hypothetical protein [Phycisphaeraceae bacterium]
MNTTLSRQPASPTQVPHGKSLALIIAAGVVCAGLSFGVGWLVGQQPVAIAALVGAVAAAAGGLVAWGVVALMTGPNTAVMAVPMLGLMVRLGVTGAGVGLAVLGLGFEKRPVLFAALFGYVVLMAMETILLYRFASSDRQEARSMPAESDDQD